MEQTLTTSRTSHDRFFDRVLGAYEAGQASDAVLMLSGMLDAALGRGEAVVALRSAFAAHPLGTLCSLAAKSGNRLGDAVARLGFAGGLVARRELGAQALERGWQAGKRVLLVDCGELGELARLSGFALDNIALEHTDSAVQTKLAAQYALARPATEDRFDLILATAGTDVRGAAALTNWTARIAQQLAPGGSLLLSAFVPGHLGWGWQAVCMGRDLHCHDEADLARAAAAAGLAITQFRDRSDSLIWAELHNTGAQDPARGQA